MTTHSSNTFFAPELYINNGVKDISFYKNAFKLASRVSPHSLVRCVDPAYISKHRVHSLTQIQHETRLAIKTQYLQLHLQ